MTKKKKKVYKRIKKNKVERYTTVKRAVVEVKKVKLYYIGNADVYKYCSPINQDVYRWVRKDKVSHGEAIVAEEDVKGILEIRGKGCSRRAPERLFLTASEYSKEFGV